MEVKEQGLSKPDAKTPIDVAYNKVVEFLIDRKKVESTWRKNYKEIVEKTKEALSKLPNDPKFDQFRDTSKVFLSFFVFCKLIFSPHQKHKRLFQFFPCRASDEGVGGIRSKRIQEELVRKLFI